MENQQGPSTWQEFLGRLIENTQERQHIATAAHVRPITLQRWAAGISRPRDENIHMLLKTLPSEAYTDFARLIAVDFPHLLQEDPTTALVQQEIPSNSYALILSAFSLILQPMCRQTVQDLILQQAIEHLDPERRGISLSLICCMPPRQGQKIRSLREIGGMGTNPWKHDLAQKTFFLGAESLVGHAIMNSRPRVINSKAEMTFFPAHWTKHEQSAAAFPILRHARTAGGLVASSAREYFFTEARVSLLEYYAYLASLIFEPEEFYDLSEVDLGMMPAEQFQIPYFHDFNARISRKFSEALLNHCQISLAEARQFVWQDLEEELLQFFLQNNGEDNIP